MAACAEGIEGASRLGHARRLGRFEISSGAMSSVMQPYEVAASIAASGLARASRSGDRRAIALASLALHVMPPEHVADREAHGPSPSADVASIELTARGAAGARTPRPGTAEQGDRD
ncbi:MAG: hypothetical protein ABR500_02055 [Dermatophilaceae bacterium]